MEMYSLQYNVKERTFMDKYSKQYIITHRENDLIFSNQRLNIQ